MSALLSGGPEALLKLLPVLLAVFLGCVLGVMLIAWLGCLLMCRRKKE